MKGTVRAKGTCAHCGTGYSGPSLLCSCLRQPSSGIYIDLHWATAKGGRLKIYSDRNGYPFKALAYAQDTLNAIRYEIRQGSFDPTRYVAKSLRELRFEAVAERYIDVQSAKVASGEARPATLRQHRSLLKLLLAARDKHGTLILLGRDVREIRGSHLEDLKLSLQTHPLHPERPLAQNSRVSLMGLVRAILRAAHIWGDIQVQPPVPAVGRPELQRRQPSDEERERIFAAIPAEHRPIFALLKHQPIRPIEACRLVVGRVDLLADTMQIDRSTRKAGGTYSLPLHPEVSAELRKIIQESNPAPHPARLVFLHERQRGGGGEMPYTTQRLDKIWAAACARAGVEGVQLYPATRHYLINSALRRHMPAELVAAAAGHSVQTMMRDYARFSADQLRPVIIPLKPAPADRPQTGPSV